MKKFIILIFLLPGSFLFSQEFYPPIADFETTQSLGFKEGTKDVTEYVTNKFDNETKTVFSFNENGVLNAKEIYEDNAPQFHYSENDKDGKHLSQRITYQFNDKRLIAIEIGELVEVMTQDINGEFQTNEFVWDVNKLPYVYDKNGRLESYTALDENKNELVFYLTYPNDNVIHYYLLPDQKDSVLVYKIQTEHNGPNKKGVETNYENGSIDYIKEYLYQDDKLVQSIYISQDIDGVIFRNTNQYNKHGDITEYIEAKKEQKDSIFIVVEKTGYKYEYAEDGIKLKEYYTADFKTYDLIEETDMEYNNGEKTVTIRSYDPSKLLVAETIKTYNQAGELISEINKSIYGEYGKVFDELNIVDRFTFRRTYTYY